VVGTLLILLVLVAAQQKRASELYWRSTRWLSKDTQARIGRMLAGFAIGLDLTKHPVSALLAVVWSVIVWGLAALTNVLLLAALGIDVPGWSTSVGIEPEPALAFALLLHLVVYAPPAALGPVSMAIEGSSWAELREARKKGLEQDRAVL
jgi:uncharacterized membrane protein YbhN (UPF0104 family)